MKQFSEYQKALIFYLRIFEGKSTKEIVDENKKKLPSKVTEYNVQTCFERMVKLADSNGFIELEWSTFDDSDCLNICFVQPQKHPTTNFRNKQFVPMRVYSRIQTHIIKITQVITFLSVFSQSNSSIIMIGELNLVHQIIDSIAIDNQVFKQINCMTEFVRLSAYEHQIWMYPVPLCEVDEGSVCHAAFAREEKDVEENIDLYERLRNLKRICNNKQESLINKLNNLLPTIN